MNKRTLALVLSIVALISIGYAVYRSLPERITTVENGNEVVYGEPQYGLLIGLFLLASACIAGIVYLATRTNIEKPVQHLRTDQPIQSNPVTSSSYRPLS